MGWEMYTESRPKMYDYMLSSNKYVFNGITPSWNWAAWTVWRKSDAVIRYINDSNQPIRFNKMSMRILSCNSGGRAFWAHNGYIDTGSYGHSATYTVRSRVCNVAGAKDLPCDQWNTLNFQEGTPAVNRLDRDGFNMNYPGTSKSDPGQFGNPPYEFPFREFPLLNIPEVLPGGFVLFHLHVADRESAATAPYDPTIRFSMNPLEMKVEIEPQYSPYIWRAYKENGKIVWHLVRPIQLKTADKWKNIEGDDK